MNYYEARLRVIKEPTPEQKEEYNRFVNAEVENGKTPEEGFVPGNLIVNGNDAKSQVWDYTCMNDGRIWPVGYCAEFREAKLLTEGGYYGNPEDVAVHNAQKDKYHTKGHPTAEEAENCYRNYLLDNRMRLGGKWNNTKHPCKVCGEYTDSFAEVDNTTFDLCEKHLNRETVESIYPKMGKIVSS